MAAPDEPSEPAGRVEFDLRSDDIRAAVDLLATDSAESWRWARQSKRVRLRSVAIASAMVLFVPVGLLALVHDGPKENLVGLAIGVFASLSVWMTAANRRAAVDRYREVVLGMFDDGSHDVVTGACSVELSREGVTYQTPLYKCLHSWSAVRCVRVTGSAILIGVRERRMMVIPATAFERPSEYDAFARKAQFLLEAGGGGDAGMLRRFLAEQDVACPGCGYNLRGGLGESCPECHAPLDWMTLRHAASSHHAEPGT